MMYYIIFRKTGVCQKQHKKIQVEIMKAWNYGTLTYSVKHRSYNYNLYYDMQGIEKENKINKN